MSQELAYRTRSRPEFLSQTSEEQLMVLINKLMEWRRHFDPENSHFPDVWQRAESQYFGEAKEEEPSPNKEIYGLPKKSETLRTPSLEIVATNNIQQNLSELTDDTEYDPTNDPDLSALHEVVQENQNNARNETVNVTKVMNKMCGTTLNPKVPSFVPSVSSALSIKSPSVHQLDPISEDEEIPPSSPESIASPLTQPASSENSALSPTYDVSNNTPNNTPNSISNPVITAPATANPVLLLPPNYNYIPNIQTLPVLSMPPQMMQSLAASIHPISTNQVGTQHRNGNNIQYNPVGTAYGEQSRYNAPSFMTQSTAVQPVQSQHFERKFNNGAKGNFYIHKDMISKMMDECIEQFDAEESNHGGLAFSYFKESVAMQINDGQIKVNQTHKGPVIIINIDLHFVGGKIMYLVAMENDAEFRHKVAWSVKYFMSADDLYSVFKIGGADLPKSSRNMPHFERALNTPPVNVPESIIESTNFRDIPKKGSKKKGGLRKGSKTFLSVEDLKNFCYESWYNEEMIPVVVIKGKKQWIEWKKPIKVYGDNWVCISLRYYRSNRRWKIECMDYDHGRMYYQHRLVGSNNHQHTYSYNELAQCVTTSLSL